MGILKVDETPKESQSKAVAILRDRSALQLIIAFDFIEKYYDSKDDSRRKDAHKLWAKLIDKAIPNTSVVQHEHNGSIDEAFAKKLAEISRGKNITELTEIVIEENKQEAEQNATERVLTTTDAKGIHNSLREFLES